MSSENAPESDAAALLTGFAVPWSITAPFFAACPVLFVFLHHQ